MRIPGVRFVQGRNSYGDRDGTKYAIAVHNTSNDASAANEAAFATRRTDGVSAHLYVDRGEVIQSLDLLARAGHAGSQQGNEHAIAVEITGVNGWSREQWLRNVAWDQLGAALAWCCRQFGIAVRRAAVDEMRTSPRVRAFYSHDDMRRAWGGTDHTDPGPGFPWDRLFQAVNAALVGAAPSTPEVPDMQVITIARSANGQWYACDGATSRPITQAEAADIAYLAKEGRWGVCWGTGGVGTPRDGWYEAAFGRVEETRAERAASYQREADTLAATQQVLAAIRAAGGDPSALDQAAIVAHINQRADEVKALLEEAEAENRALRERLADALLRAGGQ